jgi:hypothetical protein
MTREELATMIDQELLAYEREHHDDPDMTLAKATAHQTVSKQRCPAEELLLRSSAVAVYLFLAGDGQLGLRAGPVFPGGDGVKPLQAGQQ